MYYMRAVTRRRILVNGTHLAVLGPWPGKQLYLYFTSSGSIGGLGNYKELDK
jgi:hypothetical protein